MGNRQVPQKPALSHVQGKGLKSKNAKETQRSLMLSVKQKII